MTAVAHSKFEFRNGRGVYFAECPEHGRELKSGEWKGVRTVTLRGQQVDMANIRWDVWRCAEANGHLFNAVPAIVPKNREELLKWEKQQRTAATQGKGA